MATCPYCMEREGNKSNTHFLTDSIIRPCINEDGSNEREKGLYFDVSTRTIFSEAKFQRSTTPEAIEQALGRSATDDEIEENKKIPFSVDNVFCIQCEALFTAIETKFTNDFLSQFRESDLTNSTITSFESLHFRRFFLLQVWRTAVCNSGFKISSEIMEKLRLQIRNPDKHEIKAFSLNVTYLQTDKDATTSNFVGYTADAKAAIIFFCDFVIQFFEDVHTIPFHNLYGVNHLSTFHKFNNYREKQFLVKVLSNDQRLCVLGNMHIERTGPILNILAKTFIMTWEQKYKSSPSQGLIEKFVVEVVKSDGIPQGQWLSKERISKFTLDFVNQGGQ